LIPSLGLSVSFFGHFGPSSFAQHTWRRRGTEVAKKRKIFSPDSCKEVPRRINFVAATLSPNRRARVNCYCLKIRALRLGLSLLGQRFCMVNRIYQQNFDDCFVKQYSMIHRLETNKLRNVAKFFAHLLGTDALPWQSLAYIRLTEEDTTSSSRIFIKILFQVWGYALSFGELYTGPFLVKTLWGSVCMLQLCCLMWNSAVYYCWW
jgi:hypothetical protein